MPSDDRPILVTGAGGFIGGRLVEVLSLSGYAPVRASIRRWASAARIGRLPVEIVQCDILDSSQVQSAMKGVRAVIHCAKGGPDGTTIGTRNLLQCALDTGVERVVYFSTIEVYGDAEGDLDESVPTIRSGRPYGDSKIEAEETCLDFVRQGLPVAILRPSLVYGPFSTYWTVELAERLVGGGTFPAKEDAGGVCNLVYVDDVVAATLLALRKDSAVGEAFNVNGPERVTWAEYLEAFRNALELSHDPHGGRLATRLRSLTMTPVRAGAKAALKRFEKPIMELNKRSPVARRAMKSLASTIQQTPSGGEYRLLNRNAYFPIDKARTVLGFRPSFTLSKGMELSLLWLDHHGFRGSPRPVSRTGNEPAPEDPPGVPEALHSPPRE